MTHKISGAHILTDGVWNGVAITKDDVARIAEAFGELNLSGRVPLKFGHNKQQPMTDGMPALGWVERVWNEGGKLLADFSGVPTIVRDAISKGLYKFTSVELLRGAKTSSSGQEGGKEYPFVLDAVALLGADPPAVSGLSDLQALTYARDSMQLSGFSGRCSFSFQPLEAPSKMDELVELKRKLAEQEEVARAALREKEDLARKNAELETFQRKQKIDGARAKITIMLDSAVTEGKLTPAGREMLVKLNRIDSDEHVMNIDVAALQGYISAMPATQFSRKSQKQDSSDKGEVTFANADELLARESSLLAAEKGITLSEASRLAFMRNPEAARKWMFRTDHFEEMEAE